MKTVRVDIKPLIFDWVKQAINIDEIGEAYKNEFTLWMNGAKKPTFNQLEKFSKVTGIPFGYFFLTEPPAEQMGILEYRTVNSLDIDKPSRNLVDTIHQMEDVQDWVRSYVRDAGLTELAYVGKLKGLTNISDIAQGVRDDLNLEKDWFTESVGVSNSFKLIRERLENIGTIVMMNGIVGSNTHRSLNILEFRAFTLIDKHAPLIFINACDSDNGRLFSLVHEMIHIWLGEDSFYNDYQAHTNGIRALEVLCNAVAAEILVPLDLFISKWRQQHIVDIQIKIERIAAEFKCGTVVIARRALDSGFIDKFTYDQMVDEVRTRYLDRKRQRQSGGDYYNTVRSRTDSRFLQALIHSVIEGKTTYTEAFRLTNTNRKTFSELSRMVVGPER